MRNIADKTDNVSTLSAAEFNASIMQELENTVTNAGVTLDPALGPDTNDEMLAEAVTRTAQGALSYQDSGEADAYVLTAEGGFVQPTAYTDGMTVLFQAGNANTGASTINVSGIGVTDLKDKDGSALSSGDISEDIFYMAKYDLAGTEFRVVFGSTTASAADVFASQLFHVQDQKVSGSSGQSMASGETVRTLNTVLTNEISGASLSSNRVTLPAGVYYVEGRSGCYSNGDTSLNRFQSILKNYTDTSNILRGSSEINNGAADGGISNTTFLSGRFELLGTKEIEFVQYNSITSDGGDGASNGTEVFTDLKIWKVS